MLILLRNQETCTMSSPLTEAAKVHATMKDLQEFREKEHGAVFGPV